MRPKAKVYNSREIHLANPDQPDTTVCGMKAELTIWRPVKPFGEQTCPNCERFTPMAPGSSTNTERHVKNPLQMRWHTLNPHPQMAHTTLCGIDTYDNSLYDAYEHQLKPDYECKTCKNRSNNDR